MEKHLPTGKVCYEMAGNIMVMEYLEWLKFYDWSKKADKTINEIIN